MGPPEVKGRGECPKIRKRSKGCVEWYTICAYGSGVQGIKEELYALADEPHPKSYVKKIKGHSRSPLYSFRVGRYRAILIIEGNTMIITLVEVGNRSKVYRKY